MTRCTKCKTLKDDAAFPSEKRKKNGLQSQCRQCQNDFRKARYNEDLIYRGRVLGKAKSKYFENPKLHRTWTLKNKYGITLEQYEHALKDQNGVCAICKLSETVIDKRSGKPKLLAVDHNHNTGKVRGLLCSQCNRSLGGFQDSVKILEQAINYLV